MERGTQQDVVAPLHCPGLSRENIDEDQPSFMHPSRELRYLEGSWLSFRKRTRSVLQPSPCSLSQQRPPHLTLHILTSDEVRALKIRRALRDLTDVAEDRAGPRLPPRLQDLASLRMARKL